MFISLNYLLILCLSNHHSVFALMLVLFLVNVCHSLVLVVTWQHITDRLAFTVQEPYKLKLAYPFQYFFNFTKIFFILLNLKIHHINMTQIHPDTSIHIYFIMLAKDLFGFGLNLFAVNFSFVRTKIFKILFKIPYFL